MKKEDLRFFTYLGIVVAVVIIVAFFLTTGDPDLSFGRSVFYGLIKGDESVKGAIDWDSLKAVGLDVGAESPEEVALAIVAEVQAVFSGREGGQLRVRKGAIHS